MWFGKIGGGSHQDVLESFYKDQAELYDSYRCRMLHGRLPLIRAMPKPKGGTWVDMGGGTGANLEFLGPSLNHFGKVVVLDLCPSLAEQAKARVARHADWGWDTFVSVTVADATDPAAPGLPGAGTVDVVSFSYALTMIPDWQAAVQNAKRLLKKGGHLCVCDFTVDPEQQGWGMPWFWRRLFATDHVHLREEHRVYLRAEFTPVHEDMGFGTFPYVPPFLRAPWYNFIGKKE